MFGGLIPLVILGAIVYAIVKGVQGRREVERSADAAPLAVKRVLVFGSLYTALHVAAWGLAGLFGLFGDSATPRGERAAEPLAMAIVAVPIVFFLARWVWQGLGEPAQRDAAFSLYVNVTVLTALVVVMITAIDVGDWLVSEGSFSATTTGALLVWTPIWAVHWWLWRRYRREVSSAHLFLGVIGIFVTLAIFAGRLVAQVYARLLDAGTDVPVGVESPRDVEGWLVGLVVSGLAYALYWLFTARPERREALWNVYVVLVGVMGGLIAAVAGAGIAAFAVLQWWFGEPETASAVRHFEDYIPAVTAFTIGAATWLYHRYVLGPVRGPRTEVQRVYDYVVAGVGLVTAIVGAVILLVAFQEAVFPPDDTIASDANTLLAAITTLAIGLPVWLQAWRRTGRYRAEPDGAEIGSPTRRSYLFGVLGLGGAAAAIALLVLLVVVFDALLGEGGSRLREDVQIPLAILITVGAAAAYHLFALRSDQEAAPEPGPEPKNIVLVTADDDVADVVRELTGARVTVLHRLDANGAVGDADGIAAAVMSSEHTDLLVVSGDGVDKVIPYRR